MIDEPLEWALKRFPAVMITGPRAAGKTTSARRVARSVVRLDRPRDASAFRADPDVALAHFQAPVLLDEWQEVPEVLAAVKRAVDDNPRPGRFLLTGSVRADLDTRSWPGTGRVVRMHMETLTLAERHRVDLSRGRALVDRLFDEGASWLVGASCDLALDDYLDAALQGGWPAAPNGDAADRRAWLDAYVDHLVTRDALHAEGRRDPEGMRRWLLAYAANVSTIVDHKRIYDTAGLAKATGEAYAALMQALWITRPLPAWWTNEIKRLARRPKLHFTDPALVGVLLGLDIAGTLKEGMHGQILEDFAVAQLRSLCGVARVQPRLHHLRQRDGREIDLVLERADRRLVAAEIKATSAPKASDAAHLRWFRAKQGDRVAATLLGHTGPTCFAMEGGVVACPIGVLLGVGRTAPHYPE